MLRKGDQSLPQVERKCWEYRLSFRLGVCTHVPACLKVLWRHSAVRYVTEEECVSTQWPQYSTCRRPLVAVFDDVRCRYPLRAQKPPWADTIAG